MKRPAAIDERNAEPCLTCVVSYRSTSRGAVPARLLNAGLGRLRFRDRRSFRAPAVLEPLPPAGKDAVHGGCAEDRPLGHLEVGGVEDERPGLEAADAAVEGDQLFEGAAFVEAGVVEAADHDVADVLEAVGAEEVLGGVG